jgi:ABC-2 type transport system permease protein
MRSTVISKAMRSTVVGKSLWDSRRGFTAWAIGLAGATAMYTSVYATIDPDSYSEAIEGSVSPELIEAFGWDDIGSPAGYLGSTVFGLIAPILLTVFAIGVGSRFLAGDEEAGTLELIATHPISRRSLLLQRAVAAGLAVLGGAAVVFATVATLSRPVGLDVPLGNVAAACVQLGLVAVVFAALPLAVGAVAGKRVVGIGVAAVVAVLAYFGDTVLPTIDGFGWVETLSLYHHYDGASALTEGIDPAGVAVLVVTAVALCVAALLAFDRRDIGTA